MKGMNVTDSIIRMHVQIEDVVEMLSTEAQEPRARGDQFGCFGIFSAYDLTSSNSPPLMLHSTPITRCVP